MQVKNVIGLCLFFNLFLLIKLQIFDVNLKSAFLLAKDAIPLMEKRG